MSGKPLDIGEYSIENVGCRSIPVLDDHPGKTPGAILGVIVIHGFGNPIGVADEDIARSQIERVLLQGRVKPQALFQAQRDAPGIQFFRFRFPVSQQQGRIVTGPAIGQLPAAGINCSEEYGHKPVPFHCSGKQGIDLFQDGCRCQAGVGKALEEPFAQRHVERGSHSLARDIADDQAQLLVPAVQPVIIIPAGFPCRNAMTADVQSFPDRGTGGKQLLLDRVGQIQFIAHSFIVQFLCNILQGYGHKRFPLQGKAGGIE